MVRKKLSFVISCYYNEENIPLAIVELEKLREVLKPSLDVEYVFIDDGSGDKTFEKLLAVQRQFPQQVKVIKLARNFGANNATSAGLKNATGDCCIILAPDLQDPPELIPKMVEYWTKGIKLVVANRISRNDPFLNNLLARLYHRIMRKYVINNAVPGGGDLWLIDRSVVDQVLQMDEKNTVLPYLFQWMGFEYVNIPYERRKREVGKSRWTFSKRVKSSIDSFVSFTYLPLRMISMGGFILGFLALSYVVSIFWGVYYKKIPVEGWSSLMVVLLTVSSFIMISLGIIGEYLWRTLDAARNRPSYIVDKIIDETATRDGNKVS